MKTDAEAIYRRWIELYDAGDPDSAMAMTAAHFAMVDPSGQKHERQAALQLTQQMKQYIEGQGLSRKTEILSLHVVPITEDHAIVHAQVELAFFKSGAPFAKPRFNEVLHIGPEGITFDAFSRISDAQGLF